MIAALAEPAMLLMVFCVALVTGSTQLSTVANFLASSYVGLRVSLGMALVATEPLTRNEIWVPFARGELRVFVAGEPVWSRTRPASQAAPAPLSGSRATPPGVWARAGLPAN